LKAVKKTVEIFSLSETLAVYILFWLDSWRGFVFHFFFLRKIHPAGR
jgi:hypothetical protein